MILPIVIIGGGQAGAQAIDTLRREGYVGRIVLPSDEAYLAYQRPPLSKRFLSGDLDVTRLPFRHQSFYDEHSIGSAATDRITQFSISAQVVAGHTLTKRATQYEQFWTTKE